MRPNRRGLISAGMCAALAGACATAPAQAAVQNIDLSVPADRLRAYMLMRGALDDRLVVGCVTGRYYGVVGSEVKPLFGVVAATFVKFRPDGVGGYSGASYEVPFFTDLNTGEVMDRWFNPYTDETVDVPHNAYPGVKIAVGTDLKLTVPNPPPGLELDHHVLPATVIGNDVWMVEETFSTFQIPGGGAPIRYTEILTLHALLSDLNLPRVPRVSTQVGFQAVVSWRPWLNMGVRPGHLLASGTGLWGVQIDALPPPLLRAIQARKPEVLADPGAPLDALLA